MSKFGVLGENQRESYGWKGQFLLENFRLPACREILAEDLLTGQKIKLIANGLGNRGELTFDLHLDDQTVILFPVAGLAKSQLPRDGSVRITQGDFVIYSDKDGNLKIENAHQSQIGLDFQEEEDWEVVSSRTVNLDKPRDFAMIEAGSSGKIVGDMNGKREFVLSTIRETSGNLHSKYPVKNEDAVGVNMKSGRVVIADGVGGNMSGELASHLVAEEILTDWEDWNKSILNAQAKLAVYSEAFVQWKKPDAVAVGAEIKGDIAELFAVGDARWMLIRGKTVFNSSTASSIVDSADQSELDRSIVTNSFLTAFQPHLEKLELKKGDLLLLCSDGLAALDAAEIIECTESDRVEKIQQRLLQLATKKNQQDGFMQKLKNGKEIRIVPPYDNLSLFVYRH